MAAAERQSVERGRAMVNCPPALSQHCTESQSARQTPSTTKEIHYHDNSAHTVNVCELVRLLRLRVTRRERKRERSHTLATTLSLNPLLKSVKKVSFMPVWCLLLIQFEVALKPCKRKDAPLLLLPRWHTAAKAIKLAQHRQGSPGNQPFQTEKQRKFRNFSKFKFCKKLRPESDSNRGPLGSQSCTLPRS